MKENEIIRTIYLILVQAYRHLWQIFIRCKDYFMWVKSVDELKPWNAIDARTAETCPKYISSIWKYTTWRKSTHCRKLMSHCGSKSSKGEALFIGREREREREQNPEGFCSCYSRQLLVRNWRYSDKVKGTHTSLSVSSIVKMFLKATFLSSFLPGTKIQALLMILWLYFSPCDEISACQSCLNPNCSDQKVPLLWNDLPGS